MKAIKLKTDKSIRGAVQKSGTEIKVTDNVADVRDDKTGLTIGILCAQDLIRRGDAEEVGPKSSTQSTKA